MTVNWYGIVQGETRAVGSMTSPWGGCTVTACREGMISIDWAVDSELSPVSDATSASDDTDRPSEPRATAMTDSESTIRTMQLVEDALEQLEQYFAGIRQMFTLPLVLRGTEFQKAVWAYLLTIPYGETRSYGDVARAIGREKAVRAVGQANRANPIPIVVPCHRVIGQTGALTGYAGSQVHLKAALLNLEQEHRLVQSGA